MRLALSVLNAGKNTAGMKVYQPFCAAPDFQLDSFSLFSYTGHFPLLKPDNVLFSW
jgi:hypothetical protein